MENKKIKHKRKEQECIIGIHPVMEAINAGKSIVKILIKRGSNNPQVIELVKLAREFEIPTQQVPNEKLAKISRANHQGIIAFVSPIPYCDISSILPGIYEKGKDPFLLLLDGITDIRNFGAIARSAEAAGVDAIIVGAKKSAMVNADAIKTSAGALNRIPVCREQDLAKAVKFLQESGIKLYGASEKANDMYFNADYSGPLAIVMGAEDTGITNNVLRLLDGLVKIPMNGNISSLNVGVACGIILFEAVKQSKSNSVN